MNLLGLNEWAGEGYISVVTSPQMCRSETHGNARSISLTDPQFIHSE